MGFPTRRNCTRGIRKLKTFQGYTVDLRLQQLRKVVWGKLPEFIDFDSPEGQVLVSQMHEYAMRKINRTLATFEKRLRKAAKRLKLTGTTL